MTGRPTIGCADACKWPTTPTNTDWGICPGIDVDQSGVARNRSILTGTANREYRGAVVSRAIDPLRAFAVALLLLPPAIASAAPRQFNCTLTQLESRAAANFTETEYRSFTILADEEAKTITVSQGGSEQALAHVTFSQLTMNGYTAEISLGLDTSSGSLVLQSYSPNSNKSEFGVCSSKPAP